MFAIQIDYIDLDKIYGSIQGIRWFKIHKGKYIVFSGEMATGVEQSRNWLKFTCTEDDFWNYWYDYFDMNFDYKEASYKIGKISNELKKSTVVSRGLRILNNEPLESLLVNILNDSENRNMIKILIRNIEITCGKKKINAFEGSRKLWYKFPTATDILNNKEKMTFFKMDFEKEKIVSACMFVENGELDFEELKSLGYKEAMKKLKELNIMSAKSASNFCLYGLGMKEAFPVDDKIRNVMEIENVSLGEINSEKQIRGIINKYLVYFHQNVVRFEKNFQKKYLQKTIYGIK